MVEVKKIQINGALDPAILLAQLNRTGGLDPAGLSDDLLSGPNVLDPGGLMDDLVGGDAPTTQDYAPLQKQLSNLIDEIHDLDSGSDVANDLTDRMKEYLEDLEGCIHEDGTVDANKINELTKDFVADVNDITGFSNGNVPAGLEDLQNAINGTASIADSLFDKFGNESSPSVEPPPWSVLPADSIDIGVVTPPDSVNVTVGPAADSGYGSPLVIKVLGALSAANDVDWGRYYKDTDEYSHLQGAYQEMMDAYDRGDIASIPPEITFLAEKALADRLSSEDGKILDNAKAEALGGATGAPDLRNLTQVHYSGGGPIAVRTDFAGIHYERGSNAGVVNEGFGEDAKAIRTEIAPGERVPGVNAPSEDAPETSPLNNVPEGPDLV